MGDVLEVKWEVGGVSDMALLPNTFLFHSFIKYSTASLNEQMTNKLGVYGVCVKW